jgi:hypothetical protein
MKPLILTVLLFLAFAESPGAEGSESESGSFAFSGSVNRYEDFQYELPGGLLFKVEFIAYGPEGWAIRIFDPAYPSDNFCSVVTPPYRGINALQLYAWHFLGEAGGAEANVPGERRVFYFVTNKQDFDRAFETLSMMLWPENQVEQDEAVRIHDEIQRECGILTVRDIVPVEARGDSAWIESMEFDVELYVQPD